MRALEIAIATCVGLGACSFRIGTEVSSSADAVSSDADPGDGSSSGDASVLFDGSPPDAALVVPMIVQERSQYAASGSPLTATLTSMPASGNTLVVIGAANSGNLSAVTGGGVATWVRAARSATNANIEIWFGVTNGSQAAVSIARPGNAGQIWLAVSEWSGLATSSALDKAIASDGRTAMASAGTIVTTSARDLVIFAAADQNSGTFGIPSPGSWTGFAVIGGGSIRQSAWHQLVSATGTFGPQVSTSGANWDAALVALRVAP